MSSHEAQPAWRPRQVERPRADGVQNAEFPHLVQARGTDAMLARQLDAHIAADRRDKASIASMLDALADEAGAETGKLQRQVTELRAQIAEQQKQIEEMRGEIALLRGLASANRSTPPRRILRANSRAQDEHVQ
jgi:hypothetical protein